MNVVEAVLLLLRRFFPRLFLVVWVCAACCRCCCHHCTPDRVHLVSNVRFVRSVFTLITTWTCHPYTPTLEHPRTSTLTDSLLISQPSRGSLASSTKIRMTSSTSRSLLVLPEFVQAVRRSRCFLMLRGEEQKDRDSKQRHPQRKTHKSEKNTNEPLDQSEYHHTDALLFSSLLFSSLLFSSLLFSSLLFSSLVSLFINLSIPSCTR